MNKQGGTGMVIPANPGMFYYRGPGGRHGDFRPAGKWHAINREFLSNPRNWDETGGKKGILAARLFVGLSVGNEPRWTIEDVIQIVQAARPDKPDSSYVLQKGVYRHKVSGEVVIEDAVQVIVIDVWKTRRKQWEADMTTLAEKLAAALQQEEVIVEIQRNGLTKLVMGVTA